MVESVEGLVNKTRLKRATCGQLAETNASLQPHTSEDELEQGAVATVTEGSQTAGNLKTKGVRAEEEEKESVAWFEVSLAVTLTAERTRERGRERDVNKPPSGEPYGVASESAFSFPSQYFYAHLPSRSLPELGAQ